MVVSFIGGGIHTIIHKDKQKILHHQNSSKIESENRSNRCKIDTINTPKHFFFRFKMYYENCMSDYIAKGLLFFKDYLNSINFVDMVD